MMENIKYYSADVNTTLGIARNAAIERSNGEIIAFLDVDDYWKKISLNCKCHFLKRRW
jgi:glycosyltransferase involved in cell wall biosynthesis